MGTRSLVELAFQLGENNSLKAGNLVADVNLSEQVDTLDKALSVSGTLAASEVNTLIGKGDIGTIRLLYIEADGDVNVFLGGVAATVAMLTGVGGVYPTLYAGGETLILDVDGVPFTTTFDVLDQALADVINRINAAAAFAGLNGLVASNSGGQLRLTSKTSGLASVVSVTGGTGLVALGLTAPTTVTGVDPTPGTSPILLRRTADPASSQITVLKAYALLAVSTPSVTLSNPSATAEVRYRIAMAGDLVPASAC
jgi:hypothetical protein